MNALTVLAKATGIGLSIWLLGRAIRTAHPLDRAGSVLRWSVVVISALVYGLSFRRNLLPEGIVLPAIFAFTLFFFLPDVSYYLVLGVRAVIGRWRVAHPS